MAPVGKALAAIGILVSAAGLAINFWIIVGSMGTASAINPTPRSLVGTLVYFWSFYTHLTNLALIVVYIGALMQTPALAWLRRPGVRAGMAGHITLVMGFYHFMLAPHYTFTGGPLVANTLMHYVAPVVYLVWWAAFVPHGTLRLRQVPLMLVPGVVYVAWVLLRGLVVAEYPYDILDAGKFGYGRVAIGVAVLLVMVAVFCAVLVGIDRLLGRRARAASL